MKLTIRGANTQALRVDLPTADRNYAIPLLPTEGLEIDAEYVGSAITVHSLKVTRQTVEANEWFIPRFGTIGLSKPLVASGVTLEGRVPLTDPVHFTGRLGVDLAEFGGLTFRGAGIDLELAFAAKGIVLEQKADHSRILTVDLVDLSRLTANHALGKAEVGKVILRGLRAVLDPGGDLCIEIAGLGVREALVAAKDVDARVERLAVEKIRVSGREGTADDLAVGALVFAMSNLPIPDPFASNNQPKPPGPIKFQAPKLPDVPFLDDLRGIFNVDATVDIAVPIIKSRLATHKIRMDLIDGTFDFKRIEKGLAGLEDAVLDFEVKPGKLILEKDIPLIPFDNTTLVWWPLEPAEHENAKKNKRVRLRRMLDFNLTDFVTSKLEAALNNQGGSSFFKVALNRLNLDHLECDVELGGPSRFALEPFAVVAFGAEGQSAIKRLRMNGSVHFATDADLDPTEVNVEVEQVRLGLERLSVRGYTASIDQILVGTVPELKIIFNEILPDTVQGTLHDVTLKGLQGRGWSWPPVVF